MGTLSVLRRQMAVKIYEQDRTQFRYMTPLRAVKSHYKTLFGTDSTYKTTTWLPWLGAAFLAAWVITSFLAILKHPS